MPDKRAWLKLLRPVFGITLLCALIAFVDFARVGATLRNVEPGWVGGAVLVVLTGTLIGALAVHMLLNIERRLPFTAFLPVYWTAWAVGLVFPGQVGDMATMATMLRRHQLPPEITLGRTLADKLVSLLLMVLFALAAIRTQAYFPAVLGVVAVGVAAGLALLRWRHRLSALPFLTGSKAAAFMGAALAETARFARAHPALIAINVVLTFVKIVLTGTGYWCMFNAFGFPQSTPFDMATLAAITSLVAYIPISFNGIGTAEAAGIAVFGSVGMTPAAVLGTYLLLRSVGLASAWIPAGAWLLLGRRRAEARGQDRH